MPTFKDGTEIPRDRFYLHHILSYNSHGQFVAGCSNERANWGPDHLPYPYRLVLEANDVVHANGFHMNHLKGPAIDFFINYTVAYKVHVPSDPPVRVVESFYYMDNFNVPGGQARNSTYTRQRHVAIPKDMIIVSMNGHLHQGGKRLLIQFEEKGRSPHDLCISYNLYHDSFPCAWDCDEICPYKSDWTFQWDTTTCYMELPVRRGEKLISTAEYDNSCSWRGVTAWWFSYGFAGRTIGGGKSEPALNIQN